MSRWLPTIAIIAAVLLFVGAHIMGGGLRYHLGAPGEAADTLPVDGNR